MRKKRKKFTENTVKTSSPTALYRGSKLRLCTNQNRGGERMPTKPNTPCRHPGCPALVPAGTKYCEKHRTQHPEDIRSASSRGYNHAWRKASKQFLQTHPLCEECKKHGRYTKATVVDHVIPHRGDQKLFWDRSNWRALCKHCHDRKTGREDSRPTYHY